MGDGINDVPALRVADVGISVDSGVDIAKELATVILLEKSLMVLEEGVIEGRKVFVNILKYIRMGASSNFWKHVQCAWGERLPPFSADDSVAGADELSPLRFFTGSDSHG
jgi:P-type Mg2+ transporter